MKNCTISDTFQSILNTSLAVEIANAVGMQDAADDLIEGLEDAVQTLASMPEELFTEDELEFLSTAYGANK
tara:strand:- start:3517 stop:3729 length:213 start_codon:yes stop_codon:yes gene_type:complete